MKIGFLLKWVLGFILVFVLFGQYFYLFQLRKTFSQQEQEWEILKRLPFSPSQVHYLKKKGEVNQFSHFLSDFEKGGYSYREYQSSDFSVSDVTRLLGENKTKLEADFIEKQIAFPSDWNLGFEEYADRLVPMKVVNLLGHQVSAVSQLLQWLGNADIDNLLNVYREPLENLSVHKGAGGKVLFVPIELTFECSEQALRKFFQQLLASRDYLFQVRFFAIENEEQNSPVLERRSLVRPSFINQSISNVFSDKGGLKNDEDVSREGSAKILRRFLGDEKLQVFLRLDLVVWQGNPVLKK